MHTETVTRVTDTDPKEGHMATTAPPRSTETAPPRARAVGTRVAVTGLILAGLVPFTYLVAGTIAGLGGGDTFFFIIGAAVAATAAFLVWRFGTWAKAVGILATLFVGMTVFWSVFGLAYPASVVDFLPGVMAPLGILLGIGGSITALVKRKRKVAVAGAGERTVIFVAAGLSALALLASATLHLAGGTSVDPAEASGATQVTMATFEFTGGPVRVEAGETTTILVRNDDPIVHTFTIDALGVDEVVLPGSEKLVRFTADEGTYVLYCKPHSDPDDPDPDTDDMATHLIAS